MKKITNIFIITLSLVLFQNCEEDQFESNLSYVTFGDSTYSTGVDIGGVQDFDVTVYTTKNVEADTSFSIIVIDSISNAAAGSYVVPASVSIPAGSNSGTFTVTLSDVNLGIGINKLVLNFDNVDSAFASGNNTTIEYIQNCAEVQGTLDLSFDQWGSEVSWEILDSEGGLVLDGGGYSDGTPATDSINITLCSSRSYTITFFDSYGDGWGTDPAYTLTIGGEVKATGNGDLGGTNGGTGEISITIPFDTN